MKKYILQNLQPLLIGFTVVVIIIFWSNMICDLIVKIHLINNR